MIETGAPTVLYTSADFDGQGGALRCLMDMGNEIGASSSRTLSSRPRASCYVCAATPSRALG